MVDRTTVHGAAGVFLGPVTVGGRKGVSWPHRIGAVPRLAVQRQTRPADDLLAASVAAGGTAVVCQVLAGMGGVGKTQLAAGLAERLWQARAVDLLVWVNATGRDGVLSAYAQAVAEVTGVDEQNPLQAAERLSAWLATTSRRWLVVLDNVVDPQDLAGLWPPDTRTGRTVVTSRRRDAALLDGRQLVDVGVFTEREAAGYLRNRLGDQPHRLDEADRLAADLGYLPLALAQAAAFVRDMDLTCPGYRQRLHARRLDRLHPAVLPDGQQRAVADTWGLSIDAADRQTGGLAAAVLALAALLDPNGIPIRLFGTGAALGYCRRHLGREVDADDVHDTVRTLYRLSLADTTADPDLDDPLLRVHALVQRVVRENTAESRHGTLARTAADALMQVWPETERDTATSRLAQLLRANATNLTAVTADHLWSTADGTPAAHRVLFRAGTSLGEIGLVNAARDHYRQLHATSLRVLGPDHPDTLTAHNSLAGWQGVAGDPAGAAAGYEQLLGDVLRVLGPDHPDTLTTRGQLDRWRGAAGDPAGAAGASEQLLTDRLRVLGPDHPHTLATRHSLAYWRGAAGDPAGAADAAEQLLTDRLRVLGPDHPDTLTTRSQLARWRGAAGDPAGAVTAYEQLLTDRMRVLGPDHPHTLTTRHSLANWRGAAGSPAGAVTAFGQLLTDILRVLGPAHPDTLATRHSLANWQGAAGDPAGAATALGQLRTDALAVLGPDHPDTLATRHSLAYWRGAAGDPAEAVTALEQLLTDRLRVLGRDHPDTLATRHSLANWQGAAGDPAGAVTAYGRLLTDVLRVLGPAHPHTLNTRDSLATWRDGAGTAAAAAPAYEQLLTDRLRVLGPNHPDTLGRFAYGRRTPAAADRARPAALD